SPALAGVARQARTKPANSSSLARTRFHVNPECVNIRGLLKKKPDGKLLIQPSGARKVSVGPPVFGVLSPSQRKGLLLAGQVVVDLDSDPSQDREKPIFDVPRELSHETVLANRWLVDRRIVVRPDHPGRISGRTGARAVSLQDRHADRSR